MTVPTLLRTFLWVILLGALGLGAWWLSLGTEARYRLLLALWHAEGVSTPPPSDLWPQLCWLATYRQMRLHEVLGFMGLAALIGMGDGVDWRCRDMRRGYRLTCWRLGVAGLLLVLGLSLAVLVVPWVVPQRWIDCTLPLLSGVALWCLVVGKPAVL